MRILFFSCVLLSVTCLPTLGNTIGETSHFKGVEEEKNSHTPNDSIKLKAIPLPLFWIHNPKDYKILSDDAVSITAGNGTDLYTFVDGTYYTNNAPKLLFTPDTNFIFSARIKPAFNSIYDGGAIILYSDSLNWAKVLFEQLNEDTWGIGSSVVSDKRTDDSYHIHTYHKQVWVKLAKSGDIFNFYHSSDGKQWALVRTFHYDNPEKIKIGFYAQSPKGTECTVEFSDIRYKGVGFTDFFTGE